MGNIVDYVRSTQDAFGQRPLTRVDSLVLSWLAYLRIPESVAQAKGADGPTLQRIATDLDALTLTAPLHNPKGSEDLLMACAVSPRFKDLRVCLAVDDWSRTDERQFSAVTFVLPTGEAYLAFRGTDNTLVGWKESFNMAFQTAIPAQATASAYVQLVASQVGGPLYVGGHSKGGNLAMYAAMTCPDDVRARIQRCFAHDAPGFTEETLAATNWDAAKKLVDRTVPEESLIGMLLSGHDVQPTVVRSASPGIFQHSPFTWIIEGNDFAQVSAVSYDAYRNSRRFNAWVRGMSADDRERFIGILYKLVQATGEVTMSGLIGSIADGSLNLMLQRLEGLPADDQAFFVAALIELAATMLLGEAPANPQTPTEHADAAADKIDDITAKFNDRLSKWEQYFQ